MKAFVKQKKEREDGIKHASTLPTPDVPKLEKGNWRAVRDSFLEFLLSRQTGSNGVPLVYILRDLNTGDCDGIYATLDERLIACVHHSGAKFDSDNASVYSLIMTHFEGTEADSTIKKFKRARSSRACWNALRVHFESESSKNVLKTVALQTIRNSAYSGPKKNFDLSTLYLKHTEAHNQLVEAGLPYTEAQKIQEFQQCLKESTAIEKSVDAISEVGPNASFEEFYNRLNGKLSAILSLTQAAADRNKDRLVNQFGTEG